MRVEMINGGLCLVIPLTDMEATEIMDGIEENIIEDEDRFKTMDEERTAMRLKIEELEEKIADLEEEN